MGHVGHAGQGIHARDILALVNPIKAISPECTVAALTPATP